MCVSFVSGWVFFIKLFVQSVGPFVFTMALFQSLVSSAGFNPSHPDQQCESGTSADCVVPWAGGSMSVSGVVLIANGLSFAVSTMKCYLSWRFFYITDHGLIVYYPWFNGRLWYQREMDASSMHCRVLGLAILPFEREMCAPQILIYIWVLNVIFPSMI